MISALTWTHLSPSLVKSDLGGLMFRKRTTGAPFAPSEINGRIRRRFAALGKADARQYENLQDYTQTHATLEAEAIAQAGQHRVNEWLVKSVQPIVAGNARLELRVREVEAELAEVRKSEPSSGRDKLKLLARENDLVSELALLKAQHESNLRAIHSLRLQAEQGLESWVRYFQGLAAVYSRARKMRDRTLTQSAPAQAPHFRSIILNDVGADETSLKVGG